MGQSFYQKEGLDFLYFNRPGTAYGDPNAFGGTKMSAMGPNTRAQFFRPGGDSSNSVSLKPIELLKSKTAGTSLLQQLWFERA